VSAASRRLRLGARKLRLEMAVADDAQLMYVHGDLIEQVFVNLIDNAARYSPRQGAIRVTARKEDGAVVIEISDEGPGIPEGEREKVFDPFYRVRERDRKSGTGLGLSICRGIIRAHGGDVTAHPAAIGPGALLRLRIPQSQDKPVRDGGE
jgi:two-component system sensor histidine kinase KdpD